MVKSDWLVGYVPGTEPAKFDLIFQSWDTANKSTELSDYSVCTTWGRKNKKLFSLHVFRKRLDYPELKRAVWQLSARFQPRNILIEDKASGTQLIQELIRDGVHGVTRYEPTMDKIMRMHSVTSTFENGYVFLPTEAEWLDTYLRELISFPACKHDDQCDSTSQALDWAKQHTFKYPVFEYYRLEALRLKLNLPRDYDFVQSDEDEDEPITAIQRGTGRMIIWTDGEWADYTSDSSE